METKDPINDPVDDAARFLRLSVSVSDIVRQQAIDVLCKEIERLRAALKKIANESYEESDYEGEGMSHQNVARRVLAERER